ncbi:hypothetical protein AUJ14_02290 [Candidatus Micrarchaeota archaeon CG1_02_55_22]|nr:MAG: hypothetical protein AUJ14_02290 [Candidatus Micrarchaeota archaeon CG1_02_55_22]
MARLPNDAECFSLLERHGVPSNVVRHSERVAGAAMFLAHRINARKPSVDEELLRAAALLHDIGKLCEKNGKLVPRKDHEACGAKIILAEGWPAVASVAEAHNVSAEEWGKLDTLERKILFYCDKRVEHDAVVSLAERIKGTKERYAKFEGVPEKIEKFRPLAEALERELCGLAKCKPSELESVNKERLTTRGE